MKNGAYCCLADAEFIRNGNEIAVIGCAREERSWRYERSRFAFLLHFTLGIRDRSIQHRARPHVIKFDVGRRN